MAAHPGKDGQGRIPAVQRAHMDERKVRWALQLREPVNYTDAALPDQTATPGLDFGEWEA